MSYLLGINTTLSTSRLLLVDNIFEEAAGRVFISDTIVVMGQSRDEICEYIS